MDIRLLVSNTRSAPKLIRLGPRTLIGRSADCNVRIASDQVSRQHCVIRVDGDLAFVRDLGSANGTRLNGEQLAAETDVTIPAGSTLMVGPLKFIVQFAAPKVGDDDDTEWLPSLPDLAPVALRRKSDAGVTGLLPRTGTGIEDTRDLPNPKRPRSPAPGAVIVDSAGAVNPDLGSRESDAAHGIDAGKKTVSALSAHPEETVLDLPPRTGSDVETPDAATDWRQRASETFLLFEEDDLEQVKNAGEPPVSENAGRRPAAGTDDGIDDELRKFLTGL